MSEFAFQHGEHRVLTCDGTGKIALILKGYQRNIFRTLAAKSHMALKQEEMVRRVFTEVGTTGFVLAAVPVKDEASMELHHYLYAVFPRFLAVCEDPVHLVIKFNTSNWNHASPASYRVSCVVAKFSMPSKGGSSPSHALWQWHGVPATTEFQAVILRHTSAYDLPDSLMRFAGRLSEEDALFESYDDYLLCEAITAQFNSETTKCKGKKSKTLLNVLTAACACSRWESNMNNSHLGTHVTKGVSARQTVGTTFNEALHAELRAAGCFPAGVRHARSRHASQFELLCALQRSEHHPKKVGKQHHQKGQEKTTHHPRGEIRTTEKEEGRKAAPPKRKR